jgi:hypothetical protein
VARNAIAASCGLMLLHPLLGIACYSTLIPQV